MLVGPPGVGKSTMAHLLVWGVLGFLPDVLGYPIRTDHRRVVYLAMDRPRQIGRAMRRLTVPVPEPVLEDRLQVHQGPLPVSFAANPDWIRDKAIGFNAGTVVIDSIKDLLPSLSDEETASLYNNARQRCLAAGIEWLELHHNRKAGSKNAEPKTLEDVYGNRMITAGAGSVLSLWGESGDTVVRLSQIKTPSGELFPKWLAIDKLAGTMELHESVTLRDVLHKAGQRGITVREAAALVYEVKRPDRNKTQNVRNKFNVMISKGVAERLPELNGEARYREVVSESAL
jgi:replicative DNA helicase